MSLNQTLQSLKLASLFGGILGLGFGCVISLEPIEPCASGSNNKLDSNGECECRIGFEWCDPQDDTNLNCCEIETGDSTTGDGDGDNGDGDGDAGDGDGDAGDGDGDAGDGDGDGDGDACDNPDFPQVPPPDSCTDAELGFVWCTNSNPDAPQCGTYYVCDGTSWVDSTALLEEDCQFLGFDFAYGCWDDAIDEQVVQECGYGPGTPCNEGDEAFCSTDDIIEFCFWGKSSQDSCQRFCEEDGDMGTTYEYGECDDSELPVACYCCDSDDPDCPING